MDAYTGPDGSRRRMLALLLGGTVAAGFGATPLLTGSAAQADAPDHDSREAFDTFLKAFESDPSQPGQATDLNEWRGALAWGQGYVLHGLMLAYQAFRDTDYLDHMVDNIDAVLASRDSERGVTDYRGESLPGWRCGYPYTAGAVDLADANGNPVLQVRSVATPIEEEVNTKPLKLKPLIDVKVAAGGAPDTFDLTVTHRDLDVSETYRDLSMDPAAKSYVVTRLLEAWPTDLQLTAKDLREHPGTGAVPAATTAALSSQRALFAVHTGMITFPIAAFARMVQQTHQLRKRYGRIAEDYVEACQAALAVHDREWAENDDGEGWYFSPRGMPVPYADGTELPANQFLAPGRTFMQLAAVTGDDDYEDRVRRMTTTFRNELSVTKEQAYTWHYWLSWGKVFNGWSKKDDVSEFLPSYEGAQQVEDISHGFIDVDFAFRAYWDQLGIDRLDLHRFARTFTRQVAAHNDAGKPTVWSNVDGTGERDDTAFELISAGWMSLATIDSNVYDHVRAIYRRRGFTPETAPFGSNVMDIAHLAWFAEPGLHVPIGPMPPR